jgi:AcrR family transcriptional regulator
MASSASPSEPKQARGQATRLRLLDAAVDELVTRGYSGLTTVGVAQRAGVSRGAQQNYFPHKRMLVAEAVQHLAARQIEELEERVSATPRARDRLEVALDILFAQYSGQLFAAVVELSLAARDEPELQLVVRTGERAISKAIHDVADSIVGPAVAAEPAFAERWATVLATIRGLALLRVVGYPAATVERQWTATRRELVALLADWVERAPLDAPSRDGDG